MNVFLTFDYEIFFGKNTGSITKCMLDPTNRLIEISKKHGVNFTYFVDAGFLCQLKKNIEKYPNLKRDYSSISKQLKELIINGDDIQLHVHPHWEKATYDGYKWDFNVNGCYSLSDFSIDKVAEIITNYKIELESITSKKISSYRAGGLAVQPFSKIKKALEQNNIFTDSSVQHYGHKQTESYGFDFRKAPLKGKYMFSDNVCKEDLNGKFTEMPIGGWKYPKLFYWKLYGLGFLFPSKHKFIGDGNYVSEKNERKNKMMSTRYDNVCCDGYYSNMLNKILKEMKKKDRSDVVILGHPKSQTVFSLNKIDSFLSINKSLYQFKTFKNV